MMSLVTFYIFLIDSKKKRTCTDFMLLTKGEGLPFSCLSLRYKYWQVRFFGNVLEWWNMHKGRGH